MSSRRFSDFHPRSIHRYIALLLLLAACSGGEQQNHRPLLASNWGGTAGGPINGRLEVQVFDDISRFPFPGALVSLGDSGRITRRTDSQGIAVFEGVIGPQDVHVYACGGCDADPNNPTIPLLYRIGSFYQVNASQVSIPVIPINPLFSDGVFQGKIFDVERNETAYIAAVDEIGTFQVQGPLGSTTYHWVNAESPSPHELTFVFTRDLDEWAALDPAGGRQGFNQVALIGKAVNASDPSKQPQAGVRVTGRYFSGIDAGRPYYFNAAGQIDPSLDATTSDGRFLFLRLSPNNDLMVSAQQLGVGVGTRYIHLPVSGTTLFTLPVLPLVEQSVDLSGRVVVYRFDFQEEERKGFLSSNNVGVEGVVINFSGDTIDESLTSDSGPEIGGGYRSERHLLPNSRYIAVVLAGRTFRQTYQELQFNTRSKTNYPLAVVPLDQLVGMVRRIKGDNTSGLEAGTAEILGRIVAPVQSGAIDSNGDPIMEPIPNVEITVMNESGSPVATRAYLDANGEVNPALNLSRTSASGGFLAYGLAPGLYTVIATQSGNTVGRKTLPVYPNGVHLVELANRPGQVVLGQARGVNSDLTAPLFFSLIGGGLPSCPPPGGLGPGCIFPAAGEYLVRLDQRTGGGDYSISVTGSKRPLGLSAFRVSPDGTLNNVAFAAGLGPLAAGGRLTLDIGFTPSVSLVETTGLITLPSGFANADIRAVLVGAVAPRGEAFIGADPAAFPGKISPGYRVLSLPPAGALSYFMMATAQNSRGEFSRVRVQGLSEIPVRQDLTLSPPPRLLIPDPNEEVVVKVTTDGPPKPDGSQPDLVLLETRSPHLVWSPPDAGPIDFYRVILETSEGERFWEAWVPGNRTEITLPAFPEEGPEQLNPFEFQSDGERASETKKEPIVWRVEAIRAGGLSLDAVTFRQLAEQRVSVASSVSRFIPKWIHQ